MLFHFLFFLIYIGQQTQCSNIIDNNGIKANQTNAKSNGIKNINKKPKENPLLDATTTTITTNNNNNETTTTTEKVESKTEELPSAELKSDEPKQQTTTIEEIIDDLKNQININVNNEKVELNASS